MTTNNEVVKAFVNNWNEAGTANLRYDGNNQLTSYYTVVAKRVGDLILVDCYPYGNTTTKQLGAIWQYNPASMTILVPCVNAKGNGFNHSANVAHLEKSLAELEKKQKRARKYDYTSEIKRAKDHLETYKAEFGLTE